MGAFVTTARNRDLRRAELSFAAAWTAEWAFTVGLGIVAFRGGGAAAVGLVGLLRMVPAAVVAPLVTPLADRWRRERILVGVSTLRGLATAAAAGLYAAGAAPTYVYALAVLSTAAATLYRPAHSALLPSLCRTPHELTSANVVRGMLDSLATLLGPALAALLLGRSGVSAVLAAAAAASFWSAALLLPVRTDRPPPEQRRGAPVWAELAAGARAVGGSRDLLVLVGLTAAQTFTRGALTVLSIVVAIDFLGMGEPGVGELTAAVGAGAVLGSLVAASLVGTHRLARWFGVGVALWGLPLAALAVAPDRAGALALLATVGVGNALVDLGLFTLVARLAADRVLARVFGVLESVIALTVGLGAVLTPPLIAAGGVRTALVVVGCLGPLLVAGAWPRLRRLDRGVVVRDDAIRLLRGVPMLAPLSLPSLERLAAGLEPVAVPAGTVVVAQGDAGDRFYVIEAGLATVTGDGHVVAELGPGQAFGEIALLRRAPRTAGVVARTPLRLQTLTAARFLPVVTGHEGSAARAGDEMSRLLERWRPTP